MHIPGWNLRHGQKGDAGIAEIGQTQSIPAAFMGRLAAIQFFADIVRGRGNHGLDHIAGFRRTGWHRGLRKRWNGDADANRIDVFIGRITLVYLTFVTTELKYLTLFEVSESKLSKPMSAGSFGDPIQTQIFTPTYLYCWVQGYCSAKCPLITQMLI